MPSWAGILATLVVTAVSKILYGWFLIRAGVKKGYEKVLRRTAEARGRQVKAALDAPKGREDLVDKIRRGGL